MVMNVIISLLTFSFILLTVYSQDSSFDSGLKIPKFLTSNVTSKTRFLIYDVNPGEGFNLRRDVHVRVANLVSDMIKSGEDWVLVLPPWRHLYHWRNRYIRQEATPWRYFFDIAQMNLYTPVMEFEDFLKHTGENAIDHVLYMQRHPDGFKGGFKELINTAECKDSHPYRKHNDGTWKGYFWSMENVYAKNFDCIDVQGHSTVLKEFLKKLDARSILVDRFETVLHFGYGSVEFYNARRSMVYAKHLREEADRFRQKFLNSVDKEDRTEYNDKDWRKQIPNDSSALGGPYLGIHMRRGDYTYSHKETIPSIEELGLEIKNMTEKLGLKKVYISTDGNDDEIKELQSYFDAKILQFPRPKETIEKFKDGGVAIIDQWIVSHARYFIGTCLSTFSFRIQEDREILGFHPDTTFNCICGKQSPEDRCHPPTKWRVKFE